MRTQLVVVVAATVAAISATLGFGLSDTSAVAGTKAPVAPGITAQPKSATAAFDKTVHFKVRASGQPKPDYQWQVSAGGGPFTEAGSSSDTLTITATLADDDNLYRVVVANPSGSIISDSASLTIEPSSKVAKVKPLIDGLIDKGSEEPYHLDQAFPVTTTSELSGYSTAFAGIVVNVSWAQLEPAEGQFNFIPLDDSLAAVTTYNDQHSSDQLGVKLRLWGGFTAPEWAKTLDGPPITVAPSGTTAGGTLGRYWLSDYEQQWTDLQDALAARYDKNALLREVAVTSCNTVTAEPFVMDDAAISSLLAAGWTNADQEQCLEGALVDYGAWQRTSVDFTFNAYSDVSPGGTRSPDPAFTAEVMTSCAQSEITGQLPECILDNHGLTDSVTTQQAFVYGEIDTLWQQFDQAVPVDFQTDSPNGFNLCDAVGIGVAHHAQSIEVWPPATGEQGFDAYTPAQLTSWDDSLIAGVAPSGC